MSGEFETSNHENSIRFKANFDPSFMKEGYLQKKGQLLKGWKKRWFVCDGKYLLYYISHKDKKPNASIPLDSCTVQDGGISETWNSPRIYLTDGISGTMYCLSAEEGHAVTEWLTVLRNAVMRLGENKGGDLKTLSPRKSTFPLIPLDEPRPILSSNQENNMIKSPKKVSRLRESGSGTKKVQKQLPTNIKLENELAKAFQTIEALTKSNNIFCIHHVRDGVRISQCTTPEGITYGRGSVVVNAAPDIVAHIVSDVSKRMEWDVNFPYGKVVAAYGTSTELIHLSGSNDSTLVSGVYLSSISPPAATAIGALVATLSSSLTGANVIFSSICGGAVGGLLSTWDFKPMCYPRDQLLVKHVREHSDGSYTVIERSVVNELKLPSRYVVRAETTASGFVIQPLESPNNLEVQTLLTYITDIDVKGWIPNRSKSEFLLHRLQCLANIREYIGQANLSEDDFGDLEEIESVDDTDLRSNFSVAEVEGNEYSNIWKNSFTRNSSGGLKLIDKEIAKKQKGVLLDVLKSFGAAILEGKSAVSLSLPVRIFEARSMLERIVDLWLYAPNYLARAGNESDPIERFKLVIAFAFSGLHHCVGQQKPFNPILGETYQTIFHDGTQIFCEHTSHHPPISNFELFGKNYLLWGYFIFSGSFKTNALTQTQTGPVHIDFEDGTRISYTMPYLRNSGFLWGDRVTEILGTMLFTDEKNNLSCELRFNPDEKKGMGSMFSTTKTPSDHCRGIIYNIQTQKEIVEITGSWLDEIKMNDVVYWNMEKDVCSSTIRLDNVLPSDCRFREDLQYLLKEELEEAQEWKIRLEKIQRVDRTNRKEGQRSNHWKNLAHK